MTPAASDAGRVVDIMWALRHGYCLPPDDFGHLAATLSALQRKLEDVQAALAELLRVDDEWHGSVNSEMSRARATARALLGGDGEV